MFKMKENETIISMYTRFTNITNGLKALGRTYSNLDNVQKILRSLPMSWDTKVTAIQETNTIVSVDELIGSLMTYEIKMKTQESLEEKPKKNMAFKSSSSSPKQNESSNEEEDNETNESVALLTRKFKKFLEGKARRRGFPNKGNFGKVDNGKCFNCNRPGHRIADCPLLQRKNSRHIENRQQPKHNAMKAITWDEILEDF